MPDSKVMTANMKENTSNTGFVCIILFELLSPDRWASCRFVALAGFGPAISWL